jgi:hypothetical protein
MYLFKVTPVLVNHVANAITYFCKVSRHSLQTSTSGEESINHFYIFYNIIGYVKGNKLKKLVIMIHKILFQNIYEDQLR